MSEACTAPPLQGFTLRRRGRTRMPKPTWKVRRRLVGGDCRDARAGKLDPREPPCSVDRERARDPAGEQDARAVASGDERQPPPVRGYIAVSLRPAGVARSATAANSPMTLSSSRTTSGPPGISWAASEPFAIVLSTMRAPAPARGQDCHRSVRLFDVELKDRELPIGRPLEADAYLRGGATAGYRDAIVRVVPVKPRRRPCSRVSFSRPISVPFRRTTSVLRRLARRGRCLEKEQAGNQSPHRGSMKSQHLTRHRDTRSKMREYTRSPFWADARLG